MKKIHIVFILLAAGALAAIVSMVGDFSSYQTFASATKHEGKEYQIIATLDTTQAMDYDPYKDPNRFVFFAKDHEGKMSKVVFSGSKPQDFERSEKLTMTGKMKGDVFYCSKILMKCPSKYNNDQIAIGNEG